MPVGILLCEGAQNSPDVRVLRRIVAGRCEVLPSDSKYGMGDRIKARRETVGRNIAWGILDGDFLAEWSAPKDEPGIWTASDDTALGWRWERKEIENYLVDPVIVARVLDDGAPPEAEYTVALEAARDRIAMYQVARTALANSRRDFRPLANSFGRPRGKGKHPFPDEFDREACLEGIRASVEEHRKEQSVDPAEVERRFDDILPEFEVGKPRFQFFLYSFAGKDLLWAMDAAIRNWGFKGVRDFRERIVLGIEQSPDNVADWLPEWQSLVRYIEDS